MSAPKGPRPITRAIELLDEVFNLLQPHATTGLDGSPGDPDAATAVLKLGDLRDEIKAIDASSTHEDRGRKRRKPTKATAGKSARKSRSPAAKKAAFDRANE